MLPVFPGCQSERRCKTTPKAQYYVACAIDRNRTGAFPVSVGSLYLLSYNGILRGYTAALGGRTTRAPLLSYRYRLVRRIAAYRRATDARLPPVWALLNCPPSSLVRLSGDVAAPRLQGGFGRIDVVVDVEFSPPGFAQF